MGAYDVVNDGEMSVHDAFSDELQGDYKHNTKKSSKDLKQRESKPTQLQYKPM
jgi:hypothetical protein|tara:strand:- start:309 stop:467 length:159 start_codon:yes stop_codon:yes gene_type:complete